MKVLFACAYLPAEAISGGSARMFRVIRGIARRHEVHVLSYYEREEELAHLPALRDCCAAVDVVRRGQSLGDWRRDLFHQVPDAIALEFGNPHMRRKLDEALNDDQYDLANVEFLQMTHVLPRRRLVPTILTHHEVYHRVIAQRLRAARSPVRKLGLAVEWMRALDYELRACRRYDRVLAMSDTEAEALNRWDRRLDVGFNNTGVDCAYFTPGREPVDDATLVYAGYFRHRPNVDAALHFYRDVFPRVRAQVPHCRLLLVGGEPPPQVAALAADPAVTVTGWVEDLRPYVRRATVFVVPIVSGAGLRGKVIEAWAMGKAVVGTPLGLDGLAVRDGVNALVAPDAPTFAAAVVRLLRSPSERAALEAAGLALARTRYDWSVTLAQLEDEYHRLVVERADARPARPRVAVG